MKFPDNFICATREYNDFGHFVPAPCLRRAFLSQGGSAELVITAGGFYDLFLNGKHITKGALAPYIANPDDLVYYDRYDLTLKKGENVIGLILGNGFQNEPAGHFWDFQNAPFRSAPKVALRLEYTDEAGNEAQLLSDEGFRTAPSPIVFDSYHMGEHYDARLEIADWSKSGFDDSAWQSALIAEKPKGEPRFCKAEPIRVRQVLHPVKITPQGEAWLYDFGQNCAGVCRLKIKGTRGQKIELFHGEWFRPDGVLDCNLTWLKNDPADFERDIKLAHRDIYICRGSDEEIYIPRFTYHGFRYVLVSGITAEQATADLLDYLVMSSDVQNCGGFECSDKTINLLQEMTRRSDLANFYYFPTDCPQREKNGWTADAALSAEQMLLNFSVENSLTEWMRAVCKAQAENGSLPGIVPTTGWGFQWGNGPAWDNVLAAVPYFVYKYTGNSEIIEDSADSFIRYADYLLTRRNERGLLAIGLGDWCHAGTKEGQDYVAPLEFTDSVTAMDLTAKFAFMLRTIGRTADAERIQGISDSFRRAAREHLYDFATATAAGECQTTQAMSIFYNLLNEDEKPAAVKRLLELIHQKNDLIDVGVLGARVIFYVLARYGYADLAFQMIKGPEFPSYGYWIENDATSLWEGFSSGEGVSSRNHHFWGHISGWFIECLGGLRFNPNADDIDRIDLAPCFVSSLDSAHAYHITPSGKAECSWRRNGNSILLELSVPNSAHGSITLEKGYAFSDGTAEKPLKSGSYNIIKA